MLEKMQIWAIFLSSKWVVKQQRQLTISTMHLAQELLTNIQCSSGSRIFAKGDESLEDDEEHSGLWLEVDNGWSSAIIRAGADPLTTTQDDTEELSVDYSTVIQHFRQIGKVKKLDKWMLHELTEN